MSYKSESNNNKWIEAKKKKKKTRQDKEEALLGLHIKNKYILTCEDNWEAISTRN